MQSSFKRLFFWLSGAGTETLEQCPNWEQRKYVAFGATVLVPCIFAFIACSYALSTLTDRFAIILPIAFVWGFIILTIDRALLAGYRPFLPLWRKMMQFSLRLVVAVLMGLTIAHPLVLLLFKDTITTVVEKDRAQEIEEVRGTFTASKDKVRSEIGTVEKKIAGQRQKWNESRLAKFSIQEQEAIRPGLSAEQQKELKLAIEEATAPFNERLAVVQSQADELTPTYTKLQTELGFWQTEYERELNGQRSGLRGEGPRARSIKADYLEPRRVEIQRVGGLLEHLSTEKASLQTLIRQAEEGAITTFDSQLAEMEEANRAEQERIAGLNRKIEQDQAEAFVAQQDSLRETIKMQIDTLLAELKDTQTELASVSAEERERISRLKSEPRKDILTQTLALHELFEEGNEGGKFAFYTYLTLTALFMLVDTIPLIVKFFTKPGPYDRLLDRDEVSFESDHQAFKESNSRYRDEQTAGGLISVTKNKKLEHALVDGVEHSRAAREFLDSMIAMERSFAERLKAEQEEAEHGSPEKIAALEAMKKRFYDDLHQRMEIFFSGGAASP